MLLIMGCTASGKGSLAFDLAQRLRGEILSIDSMKVYRRMDIGTAKPPMHWRSVVPFHGLDVVEPWESFSLGRYLALADQAIDHIRRAQRPIIAVGGTAMYIRGLLEGIFDGPPADQAIRHKLKQESLDVGLDALYARLAERDPVSAGRIHRNDYKRIERALEVYEITGKPISSFQEQFRSGHYRYPWILIGLQRDKSDANHRINQRVKKMLDHGLIDEVKMLLSDTRGLSIQAGQAVGYAEIIDYIHGKTEWDQAVEAIKINTRRLAKSQRTWFRGFSGVHWFDVQVDDRVDDIAKRVWDWLKTQYSLPD